MEIDCLQRNGMFKSQITLDRHNAWPILNYYFLPDLSHFSLPSTLIINSQVHDVRACSARWGVEPAQPGEEGVPQGHQPQDPQHWRAQQSQVRSFCKDKFLKDFINTILKNCMWKKTLTGSTISSTQLTQGQMSNSHWILSTQFYMHVEKNTDGLNNLKYVANARTNFWRILWTQSYKTACGERRVLSF